jgi:hypothetical protein
MLALLLVRVLFWMVDAVFSWTRMVRISPMSWARLSENIERAASAVQRDWAATGAQRMVRARSAVSGRLELDVYGLFILDCSGEFPPGAGVADAERLAGMSVFEGFDFQGDCEGTIVDERGDLLSTEDEESLADGTIQDGLVRVDIDEELEGVIGAGVGWERIAEGEDIAAFGSQVGIGEELSAAEGGLGDEDVVPEACLEWELPMADAFRAGEQLEAHEEEGGDARGWDIEDADGEGFVGDGDGGPGSNEAQFEFAAVV